MKEIIAALALLLVSATVDADSNEHSTDRERWAELLGFDLQGDEIEDEIAEHVTEPCWAELERTNPVIGPAERRAFFKAITPSTNNMLKNLLPKVTGDMPPVERGEYYELARKMCINRLSR